MPLFIAASLRARVTAKGCSSPRHESGRPPEAAAAKIGFAPATSPSRRRRSACVSAIFLATSDAFIISARSAICCRTLAFLADLTLILMRKAGFCLGTNFFTTTISPSALVSSVSTISISSGTSPSSSDAVLPPSPFSPPRAVPSSSLPSPMKPPDAMISPKRGKNLSITPGGASGNDGERSRRSRLAASASATSRVSSSSRVSLASGSIFFAPFRSCSFRM
mmetsp:Transcript_2325/g.10593  ORF Transcript_2325/g.10593 Transcript_2325/m.10593 type:complete len:222 (+) Transcript_2325:666-1331(+)